MIPAEILKAAAAGVVVLIALLIAWKIRPKSGPNPYRNLVIVINEKALQALKS